MKNIINKIIREYNSAKVNDKESIALNIIALLIVILVVALIIVAIVNGDVEGNGVANNNAYNVLRLLNVIR